MYRLIILFFILHSNTLIMGQYVVPEDVYEKVKIYPGVITSDQLFKGNPKEVRSANSYYETGNMKIFEGYTLWQFNANRQLTEFSALHKNAIQKTTYEYDKNQLVTITEHDVRNNSIYKKTEYRYSDNGAIKEMTEWNARGQAIYSLKYIYDKPDSMFPFKIEKYSAVFSSTGYDKTTLSGFMLLEYNSDYRITKIIEYNDNGNFDSALLFRYQSMYLIQEGISLNDQLTLRINYVYRRDERNRIVERFEISDGKQRLDYKNFYTGNSLTRREYYQEDKITVVERFDYNKYNDMTLKSREDIRRSEKSATSYEIDYDSRGNPLTKKELQNGELKLSNSYTYVYD